MAITIFIVCCSINLFSQKEVTEKMLQEVSLEKQDSTKIKLYEEYFKGLAGEKENLIIK